MRACVRHAAGRAARPTTAKEHVGVLMSSRERVEVLRLAGGLGSGPAEERAGSVHLARGEWRGRAGHGQRGRQRAGVRGVE